MPKLALYGSEQTAIKCGEFNVKYQNVENFDIQEMVNDYDKIIDLMKKDLKLEI